MYIGAAMQGRKWSVAGKKVESIWKGPGIIVKAKSDTVFIVKSCREVRTMHHDKLRNAMLQKYLSGSITIRSR